MLVAAGRVAIERNQRVAEVFAELGIAANAYSALPDAPPLCFMHIPKTGGASVIMWLESMFAAREVAPCRNSSDFELLKGLDHSYRLFAGHFHASQKDFFPAGAQWMTVLREPVEMAVSAYHHRRLAPKNDWEADRAQLADGDRLRGSDTIEKTTAETMSELFRSEDLLSALKRRCASLRPAFRDNLARQFGATRDESAAYSGLDDDSPELQQLRNRLGERSLRFLDEIELVGEYSRLGELLLLVAAVRGWPAPSSLPRIHDFGAPTRADAASPELRAEIAAYSPVDAKIHSRARHRAAGISDRLRSICGGVTSEDVDAHHRRRVFADTKRVIAFDVTAEDAWNGSGWGLRERDGFGNAFRRFADGSSAGMLVRLLRKIPEYRVFVEVWDASSQDVIDGFTVDVGEKRLERIDTARRNGKLTLEWRLPTTDILATRGHVELHFRKAGHTRHETLSISRIGCVPARTVA